MPSKSSRQAILMAACAHDAGYEKCPPKSVAKEFNQADKGGKLLHAKRPGGHGVALHKGKGHGR